MNWLRLGASLVRSALPENSRHHDLYSAYKKGVCSNFCVVFPWYSGRRQILVSRLLFSLCLYWELFSHVFFWLHASWMSNNSTLSHSTYDSGTKTRSGEKNNHIRLLSSVLNRKISKAQINFVYLYQIIKLMA